MAAKLRRKNNVSQREQELTTEVAKLKKQLAELETELRCKVLNLVIKIDLQLDKLRLQYLDHNTNYLTSFYETSAWLQIL